MRGLVFWIVVALTISGGSWLTTQQNQREEMLPPGSKVLAEGAFTAPVGGVARLYHLPDGQGRLVFEKLKLEDGLKLVAYLTHNPEAADITIGSISLGEIKDARIQALDIPATARKVSHSSIILVRPEQQSIWAKTTLERTY